MDHFYGDAHGLGHDRLKSGDKQLAVKNEDTDENVDGHQGSQHQVLVGNSQHIAEEKILEVEVDAFVAADPGNTHHSYGEHSSEDNAHRRIVLGAYDLQVYVARRLAETPERRELPQTLLDMEDGDWTDLADASYPDRWFEVPLLAVLMDCASGVTEERRIEIERETQDPSNLLGDALSAPLHLEILRTPGLLDLGDGFRQAFQCDVPVLFTSGVLDARTPPENVETLLPGFPNGIHVTVTQAGHESRELMSTEYRTIVQSFLRGEPVAGCVVELPRVLLLAGR